MATRAAPRASVPNDLVAGVSVGAMAAIVITLPEPWRVGVMLAAAIFAMMAFALRTPTRWVGIFFVLNFLLPPLPVAWGSSGPHVALLFLGAGLWAGLIWSRHWRIRLDPVLGCLLTLAAAQTLSLAMVLSDQGLGAFSGSAIRVALFGASVYLFLYVRDGPGRSLILSQALVRAAMAIGSLSALLACLDFYFQWPPVAGYSAQFIWLPGSMWRRAQGVFYDASALGNFSAFWLIGIAVNLVDQARPVSRRLSLLLALPLLGALVFSFSRGSLANVAVGVGVLVLLRARRAMALIIAATGAIAMVAAPALASGSLGELAGAYLIRAVASVQYFWETPGSVLSGRLQTWQRLAEHLTSHPGLWPLGVGYKALAGSSLLPPGTIADNAYLSALVETGLVGLAALVGLVAAVLAASYRVMQSPREGSRFLGTWMFCFWCGQSVQMLSGDAFTYWRVLPLYFVVLAMAMRGAD